MLRRREARWGYLEQRCLKLTEVAADEPCPPATDHNLPQGGVDRLGGAARPERLRRLVEEIVVRIERDVGLAIVASVVVTIHA